MNQSDVELERRLIKFSSKRGKRSVVLPRCNVCTERTVLGQADRTGRARTTACSVYVLAPHTDRSRLGPVWSLQSSTHQPQHLDSRSEVADWRHGSGGVVTSQPACGWPYSRKRLAIVQNSCLDVWQV